MGLEEQEPHPTELDPATFERMARGRLPALTRNSDADSMTLVSNLVRLAGEMVADLETVHRPKGWSWAGFRLMFAVLVAGPLEPRQVAPLAGVTRASISAVLNTLERDGLVERRRDSEDRRIVTIVLTASGRRAVLAGLRQQHEIERAWSASLSATERRSLARLLRKLADGRQALDTPKG